jgi:hypothetical protein
MVTAILLPSAIVVAAVIIKVAIGTLRNDQKMREELTFARNFKAVTAGACGTAVMGSFSHKSGGSVISTVLAGLLVAYIVDILSPSVNK